MDEWMDGRMNEYAYLLELGRSPGGGPNYSAQVGSRGAVVLNVESPLDVLKLVMDAAKNYGPNLHVFMACGPMSTIYCPPIQKIITTVQAHGVKAHFLDQVILDFLAH